MRKIIFFLALLCTATPLLSQSTNIKTKCCKPKGLFAKKGAYRLVCYLATGEIKEALEDVADNPFLFEKSCPVVHYMVSSILRYKEGNIEASRNMAWAAIRRLDEMEKDIDKTDLSNIEKSLRRNSFDCLKSAWEYTSSNVNFYRGKGLEKLPPKKIVIKPIDPPMKPKKIKKKTGDGVIMNIELYFNPSDFVLRPSQQLKLDELAMEYLACTDCEIYITGYADGTRNQEYNEQLSRNRANSAFVHLKKRNILEGDMKLFPTGKIEAIQLGQDGKDNPLLRKVDVKLVSIK